MINVALQIDELWAPQVDAGRLVQAVQVALAAEQVHDGEVTLVVVGDEEMTQLHERYRNEGGTTDVLSFAHDPQAPDPGQEMGGYLGDVVICYPQALRQAAEEGHTTQDELDLLAVHGVLHLLGYDDETAEARQTMWAHQARVLETLGLAGVAPRVGEGE